MTSKNMKIKNIRMSAACMHDYTTERVCHNSFLNRERAEEKSSGNGHSNCSRFPDLGCSKPNVLACKAGLFKR